jgi:23S rRNA (adenine2503-C2)-methyltransferase
MKILGVRSFSYPEEIKSEWKDIIFWPIKDHKFSIELEDGAVIECASFELIEKGKHEMHACISTQAGCKFACHFCVSGKRGFTRNLTSQEIFGEVSTMASNLGIQHFDHVVYMGIGEPLDNLISVDGSIRLMTESDPWYAGRLSIATVGIVSGLKRLQELNLPLRMLWASLHAATEDKRTLIMPVAARACSIRDMLYAVIAFAKESNVQTWVNYMVLHGFNDLDEDVQSFARLLDQTDGILSVMITIPNGSVEGFCPGTAYDAQEFERRLIAIGVKNRIARFFAAGRPVNAGCGEFVFLPQKK